MNEYKMDSKSKILLLVITSILLIVFEISIYYFMYNKNILKIPATEDSTVKKTSLQYFIGIGTTIILIVVYFSYSFIYLSKLYKTTVYGIKDNLIVAEKGVLFRKKKIMRISSVQYTRIVSLPFAKIFGLNFIVFNGYGNKLVFTFISQNDLREITETVSKLSEYQHGFINENGGKDL